MLESVLGNKTKEKILLTLLVRDDIHARDVVAIFRVSLSSVQNQLKRLEKGGVLVSRLKGRTRLYSFNPRYAFLGELKILLKKALDFIPKGEKEKYYAPRLRPRRSGKPL
jgi:DNA-binding transcriptional ArsR family regulator